MKNLPLISVLMTAILWCSADLALAGNELNDGAKGLAPDGYKVNPSSVLKASLPQDLKLPQSMTLNSVPQRRQEGPTCGLFALGMIMDYWHERNPANATARAINSETCHHTPTTDEVILDYVQKKGYSLNGEIFRLENLAKTAAHFGYKVSLHREATMEEIYRVLDAGRPVLIAFDVGFNGEVSTNTNGLRAHYAVLEGYFDDAKKGKRYLVAKHGWAWKEHHLWPAKDFEKSWRKIMRTDYFKKQGFDCQDLPEPMRPQPLDKNFHAILDHLNRPGLASAFIEIVEPSQDLLGGTEINE